jgi:hypothetical protein
MKATLIRIFIWPSGAALLLGMSVLSLLLLHSPLNGQSRDLDRQAGKHREEFPIQRRGGGTHWMNAPQGETMA